ncbi:MAG: radical SAM protein [Peptococcaceae bacterium]|nr:radical SAM protein [Peptococcaceae bacterium]
MVRVSSGTAHVLGLNRIKCPVLPTTGYLLVGDTCLRDCGFCPRARSSRSRIDLLSRVTWPVFPLPEVVERICDAFAGGSIRRVCLQVTHDVKAWFKGRQVVAEIKRSCEVPVSVSCTATGLRDIEAWFENGADRFGLALDAAGEEIFTGTKAGSWERTLSLLYAAAKKWPGRISTHLIVGLGETEFEMIRILEDLVTRNIRVGLFAFTPVKGTRLEDLPPPPLPVYRRVQAAYYLMSKCGIDPGIFRFDDRGKLIDFGVSMERLKAFLSDGRAFQTAGCPACNRPYYNEKPGGTMYNYPRPLTAEEVQSAIGQLELPC